jgi:hypothetical protein
VYLAADDIQLKLKSQSEPYFFKDLSQFRQKYSVMRSSVGANLKNSDLVKKAQVANINVATDKCVCQLKCLTFLQCMAKRS